MYYLAKSAGKPKRISIFDCMEDGAVYELGYTDGVDEVTIGKVFQGETYVALIINDLFGNIVYLYYDFVTKFGDVIGDSSPIVELISKARNVYDVFIGDRNDAVNRYRKLYKQTFKAYLISLYPIKSSVAFALR